MGKTLVGDALRRAMDEPAAVVAARDIPATQQEIQEVLETARAEMEDAVGGGLAIAIRSGLVTEDGRRRQFVVRKPDGLEVSLFSVNIPEKGYPVGVMVGGQYRDAGSREELEALLAQAVEDPGVAGTARYLRES